MMLTTEAVSEIKAAEGVYRASDVARHYNVHRSTIKRIWDGGIHAAVSPAGDFPDISVKHKPRDLVDDIRLLLGRGMSIEEVATALGISPTSVWQYKGVWV